MNPVVCNAGPLIALSGIGQAGLLHELFGEVIVSGKVQDEVEAGGKTGVGASLFANALWIRVIRLTNLPTPCWKRSWIEARRKPSHSLSNHPPQWS